MVWKLKSNRTIGICYLLLGLSLIAIRIEANLADFGTPSSDIFTTEKPRHKFQDQYTLHLDLTKEEKQLGVKLDEDGKKYILCLVNGTHSATINTSLLTESEKSVRCYAEGSKQTPACIAVFKVGDHANEHGNQSEKPISEEHIIHRGCWGYYDEIIGECSFDDEQDGESPEKCATPRIGSTDSNGWHHCCCRSTNCNQFVYLLPPDKRDTALFVDQEQLDYSKNEFLFWFLPRLLIPICLSLVCILPICLYKHLKKWLKDRQSKHKDKLVVATDTKEKLLDDLIGGGTTDDLDINEFTSIARGRFGEVFRGEWKRPQGRMIVAIKQHFANDKCSVESYKTEKALEIYEILRVQKHEFILQFLGYDDKQDRLWIITEYMENHSLFDHLKDFQYVPVRALKMCIEIMSAVSYLHSEEYENGVTVKPMIVHRDIKSKNIFIRHDLTICLGDFGLACKYEHGSTNKTEFPLVGTRRYMAPEVLEAAQEFTSSAFKQIDVYATALVLWEILSRTEADDEGSVPEYKMPFEEEVGVVPTLGDMRMIVVGRKTRPEFRMELLMTAILVEMSNVVTEMWETEADARITARNALEKLLGIAKRRGYRMHALKTGVGAKRWFPDRRHLESIVELEDNDVEEDLYKIPEPEIIEIEDDPSIWREAIPVGINPRTVLHKLPDGPAPTSLPPPRQPNSALANRAASGLPNRAQIAKRKQEPVKAVSIDNILNDQSMTMSYILAREPGTTIMKTKISATQAEEMPQGIEENKTTPNGHVKAEMEESISTHSTQSSVPEDPAIFSSSATSSQSEESGIIKHNHAAVHRVQEPTSTIVQTINEEAESRKSPLIEEVPFIQPEKEYRNGNAYIYIGKCETTEETVDLDQAERPLLNDSCRNSVNKKKKKGHKNRNRSNTVVIFDGRGEEGERQATPHALALLQQQQLVVFELEQLWQFVRLILFCEFPFCDSEEARLRQGYRCAETLPIEVPQEGGASPQRRGDRPIRRSPARRSRTPPPRRRDRSSSRTRRRSRSPIRRSKSPKRSRSPKRPSPRRSSPRKQSPSRRVAIRSLSRNVTKEHLTEIFGIYGVVKNCELPSDRFHPHIHRGYGYIEYELPDDAEKALKYMDGGQIDGQAVSVELTLPRTTTSSLSGGGRGGRSPPPRRASPRRSPPRRGRSPPLRGSGANSIPLGGGRRRSRSRS